MDEQEANQDIAVFVNGMVVSGAFPAACDRAVSVVYELSMGNDWEIVAGCEAGASQQSIHDPCEGALWNMPIDLSLRTTNAAGWPRLVVTVSGHDFWGREVGRVGGWFCVAGLRGGVAWRGCVAEPRGGAPWRGCGHRHRAAPRRTTPPRHHAIPRHHHRLAGTPATTRHHHAATRGRRVLLNPEIY